VYVQQCLKGEPLLALMRVLGAYVAECNANLKRANGGYQVCIANDDPAYLYEIQNDAELFTNAASSITWRKKPGSHQLTFSSKIIYLLVTTLCGAHSYEKRVPDALFTLVDEYKHAFLDNYLRGDGNTQRYKTVETRRLATNSPRLAAGLGLLLSMLDLDYSLNYPQQRPKRSSGPTSSASTRCSRRSRTSRSRASSTSRRTRCTAPSSAARRGRATPCAPRIRTRPRKLAATCWRSRTGTPTGSPCSSRARPTISAPGSTPRR